MHNHDGHGHGQGDHGHGHGPEEGHRKSPAQEHRDQGPASVAVFVITVSDTRTEETDGSGRWLREAVTRAGHRLAGYRIVKDEVDQVHRTMDEARAAGADAILTNGGTGIAHRDRTYEAIQGKLEKELTGFGELFRMLSFEFVGSAAMLSRATAGTWHGVFVAAMPGSTGAVRLAWEKLLEPELPHLVGLARPAAAP